MNASHTPARITPHFAARAYSAAPRRVTRIALLIAALFAGAQPIVLVAQTAHSRLGTPEMQSSLGNPLWVRIPIEPTVPGEDVSTSRFMIGSRPSTAALPFLEAGEVTFERVGDRYFLVIRSRQAIDEPAIGLVIREQIPNGIRSREFTLLLDPPTMANVRLPQAAALSGGAESVFLAAQAVQTITSPKTPATVAAPVAASANTQAAPADAPAQRLPAIQPPPQYPRPPRNRAPRTTVSADASVMDKANPAVTVAPTVIEPGVVEKAARTRPAKAASAAAASAASPSIAAAEPRRVRPATRGNQAINSSSVGPRLTLSLGEGLNERANASEAERADLRVRRMMLDLDDLTASLLERQNRITQLEKELANLAARVGAAERQIAGGVVANGKPGDIAPLAVAQTIDATAAVAATTVAPADATTTLATETAKPAAPVKAAVDTPPAKSSGTPWLAIALGAAALALLVWLIAKVRTLMARRDESYRLVPQQADDYVAEVLSHQVPATRPATAATAKTVKMPAVHPARNEARPAQPATAAPATTAIAPEIHFELPETPPQTHEVGNTGDDAKAVGEFDLNPANEKVSAEDIRSRRMRYLQSRYQDIAILMPPIDAPQRLLRQAGTVYDEGAVDYAKRLLKYAAYSRPYAEEFWLGLLELLYREKLASDYIVNAKWFQQHLPDSANWKEIVRIGFLLDPVEPLFADARHWAHDEPAERVWLPATPVDQKPASPLPTLTLELSN